MKSFREFSSLFEKEEKPFNQRRKEVPGGDAAKEAAKGFEGAKQGGLETRLVDPKYTDAKRSERSAALGGDVWTQSEPSGKPFSDLSNTLRTRTGTPSKQWSLASDLNQSSGNRIDPNDPWKGKYSTSYEVQQQIQKAALERMRNNPTEPFGDSGFEQPIGQGSKKQETPTPTTRQASRPSPTPTPSVSKAKPENKGINLDSPDPSKVYPELKLGKDPAGSLEIKGANPTPTRGGVTAGLSTRRSTRSNSPNSNVIDVKVTDVTQKPGAKSPESKVTQGSGQTSVTQGSQSKITFGAGSDRPSKVTQGSGQQVFGPPTRSQAAAAQSIEASRASKPKPTIAQELLSGIKEIEKEKREKINRDTKSAGRAGAILAGIPAAADAYLRQKDKGASELRAVGAGLVVPSVAAVSSAFAGSKALKRGGPRLAVPTAAATYGASLPAANVSYDAVLGPTNRERRAIAATNRETQVPQLTSTKPASTRPSVTVIKDPRTGKDVPGYLATRNGVSGYYAADRSNTAQARITKNPFERLGRLVNPGAYTQSDEARRRKDVARIRVNQRESYNINKKSFSTFCEQAYTPGSGDLLKNAKPFVRNLVGRGIPAGYAFGGGGAYNLLNKQGRRSAASYELKSAVTTPIIQSVATKAKQVTGNNPATNRVIDGLSQGAELAAPLVKTPRQLKEPVVQAVKKYGPRVAQSVVRNAPRLGTSLVNTARTGAALGGAILGLDGVTGRY